MSFSVLIPASTQDAICAHVAEAAGVPLKRLSSRSRTRELVHARWLAMRALRQRGMSLQRIGERFKRDHSTVLSGLRRAEELAQRDPEFARVADEAAQIGRTA